MELTEDEVIEKYAKQCMHFTRNTLSPFESEFFCVACECDAVKHKK